MLFTEKPRRKKHKYYWPASLRFTSTLCVFIVLMVLLALASQAAKVSWSDKPLNRTIQPVTSNTAVDMVPDSKSVQCSSVQKAQEVGLCALSLTTGKYKVGLKLEQFTGVEEGTGAKQNIRMLLHYPIGDKGEMPGIIFLSGAGTGSATEAFQDQAYYFASAGFVAATIDKPVWHTTPITRDYPSMARVYDEAINMMRKFPGVDPNAIGVHCDSESGWIEPYILDMDHKIAFQILASPMLFEPRRAMAFVGAQDFSIIGANPGYQSMVRKVFSIDFPGLGLKDGNCNPFNSRSFAIPTFLAYGAKDVMTSQVDGMAKIMQMAQEAGNENFVLRDYPFADHILRIGNGAAGDTTLADHYLQETVAWSAGMVLGYKQVAPKVAGHEIYQSIGLPVVHSDPVGMWYAIVLHILLILFIIVTAIYSLVVLGYKIAALCKHDKRPVAFAGNFAKDIFFSALASFIALWLFIAAVTQIVIRVAFLAWGAAPKIGGMVYWSWYVIQAACVVVVWTWSMVITSLFEAMSLKGWFRGKNKPKTQRQIEFLESRDHFIASSKMGMGYIIILAITMLLVLLVLAFWGLFLY